MKLRVVQWTTGNVGKQTVAAIAANPDLELVGCYAWSPDKVGRDVGELCGLAPLGVKATNDVDADLARRPRVATDELDGRVGEDRLHRLLADVAGRPLHDTDGHRGATSLSVDDDSRNAWYSLARTSAITAKNLGRPAALRRYLRGFPGMLAPK